MAMHTNLFRFALVSISVLMFQNVYAIQEILIKPTARNNRNNVLLVIIPETGTEGKHYKELGTAIQESEDNYSLWIGLTDVQPTTLELLTVISTLIQNVTEISNGHQDNIPLFLAGHGQADFLVQSYAEFHTHTLNGIILLNSHLKMGETMASFPVPVLTINGELDGVTRITRIAELFRQFMTEVEMNDDLQVRSPFIVLEGINHGAVIANMLPGQLNMLDLKAQITPLQCRRLVAEIISKFININLGRISPETEHYIRSAYNKTREILLPIINARKDLQNDEHKSNWVSKVQMWLSGVRMELTPKINIDSYVYLTGVTADYQPKTLEREDGTTLVFTFSDVAWPTDVADNASRPQAPKEIKSRLIDGDRIHLALQKSGIFSNLTIKRTCRDMNYAAFLTAYHQASTAARSRYDKTNPGIIFNDDIQLTSEYQWEKSTLLVNSDNRVLYVTSYSYTKQLSRQRDDEGGLIYCKLLPPLRVMEWIYTDSLRHEYLDL